MPAEMKCGQVTVLGCDQLTKPELCPFLDLVSKNPLNSEVRNIAQAQIIEEYRKRGFFDATISWDDTTEKADVPMVSLRVKEGKIYVVRRLEMLGNANASIHTVRRRIPLQEGVPYDEDLLELGIKRINQLGIFEELTMENVKLEINKKGHFVDLTFTLKEK
jgi:outer membrane protein assembly factor BamA